MSKFVGPEKGLLGAAEPIWALSQLFATPSINGGNDEKGKAVYYAWNYVDVGSVFF